jgi:hypothetical protein
MRYIPAYFQAGTEALRWLGEESFEGSFKEDLDIRDFHNFSVRAISSVLHYLPKINARNFITNQVNPDHKVYSVGAESIVIKEDDGLIKVLSGKTEKPEKLKTKLEERYERAQDKIGSFIVDTEFDIEKIHLWKFGSDHDYVTMRQPMVNEEYIDPHRDQEYLTNHPEVDERLSEFASCVGELAVTNGLYVDVVNKGNIFWGNVSGEPNDIHLVDVVMAERGSRDFAGLNVPLWTPEWYGKHINRFVKKFSDTI